MKNDSSVVDFRSPSGTLIGDMVDMMGSVENKNDLFEEAYSTAQLNGSIGLACAMIPRGQSVYCENLIKEFGGYIKEFQSELDDTIYHPAITLLIKVLNKLNDDVWKIINSMMFPENPNHKIIESHFETRREYLKKKRMELKKIFENMSVIVAEREKMEQEKVKQENMVKQKQMELDEKIARKLQAKEKLNEMKRDVYLALKYEDNELPKECIFDNNNVIQPDDKVDINLLEQLSFSDCDSDEFSDADDWDEENELVLACLTLNDRIDQ